MKFIQLAEGRRNNFDALRLLLAAIVLFSHAKLTADLGPAAPVASSDVPLMLITGAGRLAVNAFFIISGFLITASWLKKASLSDFLWKRIARLYPGLLAALLLCIAVFAPLGGVTDPDFWRQPSTLAFFGPLVLQPTGSIPGAFTGTPHPGEVNNPIWTIRFEIACYLFTAAIGSLGWFRKRTGILMLFIAAQGVLALQMLHLPRPWTIDIPYFGYAADLPRFLVFFLAGSVFYLYRERIPCSARWFGAALVGAALTYRWVPFLGLPIFGSYILFFLAFHPRLRLHGTGRFGDLSYGMYLYAWPVQQVVIEHLRTTFDGSGPLPRLLLGAVVLLLSLLLSFLSWHLVERPALEFVRRKLKAAPGPLKTPPVPAMGLLPRQKVKHL